MVIMAMGDQEIFNLLEPYPGGLDIDHQSILGATAACIHQGGVAGKVDQIDGGIFRRGESVAADLMYFFSYLHYFRQPLPA
jgi:hypothetical protein